MFINGPGDRKSPAQDDRSNTTPENTNLNFWVQVNLCQKLLFLKNMGRTCCVQMSEISETISVLNMFSPGLSLEFSCIELVIQWTICCQYEFHLNCLEHSTCISFWSVEVKVRFGIDLQYGKWPESAFNSQKLLRWTRTYVC